MAQNRSPGDSTDVPSSSDQTSEKNNPLVVCFGEALAFKKAPGGAPKNVAVGISKLGGSSTFIGKVGADEFGYMLAVILQENNVDSAGICFDASARTALAFVT